MMPLVAGQTPHVLRSAGPANRMKNIPTVLALLLACCGLLRAQNFNLTTDRVPVASLDGLWRFHIGDNLQWADPNFDDSHWSLLRSNEDWGKQGYLDLKGGARRALADFQHIGWYRANAMELFF